MGEKDYAMDRYFGPCIEVDIQKNKDPNYIHPAFGPYDASNNFLNENQIDENITTSKNIKYENFSMEDSINIEILRSALEERVLYNLDILPNKEQSLGKTR